MNKEKQTKVGVGVMVFKNGKILMGKRKSSHGEGEYCYPGGNLEYMEGFEDCAKRETLEECGIEIKNIKFNFVANELEYAPKHYVNVSFVAEWESGEPKVLEPDKFESFDWYDLENLPEPIFAMSKLGIESYKTGKNFYDK